MYLVLDQGGHAGRALAFDDRGRSVAHAERTVGTRRSGGGIVEQDPEAIVRSLVESADEVFDDIGHEPFVGSGLACQRSSVLCWDRRTGKALTPVLSWQDTRAESLFDGLDIDREWLTATTGLPASAHYGATKLAWCLLNVGTVRDAAAAGTLGMGPLASFLLFRLLDERPYVASHTLAQRTLLFDVHALDWSDALLDVFGLPRTLLPECRPDCARFGRFRGIPFEVCAGDQNAVPFAFGAPDTDTCYLNLGTGAFLLQPLTPGSRAPDGLLRTLLEGRGWRGFAAEGTVNGAGAAFDWYRASVAQTTDAAGEPAPDAPYFINTVGDLGSPFWITGVEPRFIPADPAPAEANYAITESIAFLVRANRERMPPAPRLLLAGGLSQNRLLCRLLAAALRVPAQRHDLAEASAAGVAALLAAPGTGTGPTQTETFEPDPALADVLDERYSHWLELLFPPAQ